MNTRTLHLAGLCLLTISSLLLAADLSESDYVDKYYAAFSKPMNDTSQIEIGNFHYEVPASMQANVLDAIVDRAILAQAGKQYTVIDYVLECLRNYASELTLTPHLEASLYGLAKDSNWMIRRDALDVFGRLGRPKDHDLIVAALSDPKVDVRAAAQNALRNRPEAKATYQKFIQDHQSDPAYAASVQEAEGELSDIHEKPSPH